MVVGEVEDREAGLPQPAGVGRRRVEREAARARRRRTSTSRPSRACPRDWRARRRRGSTRATCEKYVAPRGGQVRHRAHHHVADGRERERPGRGAAADGVAAGRALTPERQRPWWRAPGAPSSSKANSPESTATTSPTRRRKPITRIAGPDSGPAGLSCRLVRGLAAAAEEGEQVVGEQS